MEQARITITVTEHGNLRITANEQARAVIAELQDRGRGEDQILAEILEPYSTNGSYAPFDAGEANPFVGLTSAPCIAENLTYGENGAREVEGRLWWFPDYQVLGCVDELRAKGEVIFQLAPERETETTAAPQRPKNDEPDAFNYQLLGRLQQDCEYYLGHGNRARKHLWAGDETEQIKKMRELYEGFREKPEWITPADIARYEAAMIRPEEISTTTGEEPCAERPRG